MSEPTFLTVLRAGRPGHTPEAEGVLVALHGDEAVFTLDDGDELTFDRVELLSALEDRAEPAARAA